MPRYNRIDGIDVQFTQAEETARDVEEQEWADGEAARTMANIREERDGLLAATDWAAMPDSPTMSDAMTKYRTALRDYPETYASNTSAAFPELGE